MTRGLTITGIGAGGSETSAVQQCMEDLRTCVAGLDVPQELDRKLWGLSRATELMVSEHAGMADELLGVYEQLGIVFDVTRRLATVESDEDVLKLFAACLRSSYGKCSIAAFYPQSNGDWSRDGDAIDFNDWTRYLISRARDERAVIVEKQPPSCNDLPAAQVLVGPVFAGNTFMGTIVVAQQNSVQEFRVSDMMLLESLSMFCGDLIRNHRLVSELREMSLTMVRSLVNAVDQKDPYTSGHSLRVGYYATMLGARLGFSERDLQMLQWSALLHDVGKIGIRDDVLKKEGKLTDGEFAHIKEHSVRSHKVVQEIPQLAEALDGVLYHHEHYDGSGYPSGLAGDAIPRQARVIQIADVFDALTSNRSYRKAFDWRRALDIIEDEAGTVVDPNIAPVFIDMITAIVDDDEDAWDQLVERAGRYTQIPKQPSDRSECT